MNKQRLIVAGAILLAAFSVLAIPMVDADDSTYVLGMNVGDAFTYEPVTNMMDHTTFYVYGSAMADEGGFMTFSEGVMDGVASEPGTYSVTVKAVWQVEDLVQEIYQFIELDVSDDGAVSPVTNTLVYGSSGFELSQSSAEGVQEESSSDLFGLSMLEIAGILGGAVLLLVIVRVIMW